jgi:uncharacterized protein YdeI (YjbR/CyaY-like superfamily)
MTRAVRASGGTNADKDDAKGTAKNDADAVFFETADDLRRWFVANHETADELWVGLYKLGSGRASIRWPEVVNEALCFGWVDGIRKGIDGLSYRNRLTPRRRDSDWSAINIARIAELEAAGRMRAAGRRAFEARNRAVQRTPRSAMEGS